MQTPRDGDKHSHRYTETHKYEPHGTTNQNLQQIYTHERERNPNVTLQKVVRPRGRRGTAERTKKNKNNQKTVAKWNEHIAPNSHSLCRWRHRFNEGPPHG